MKDLEEPDMDKVAFLLDGQFIYWRSIILACAVHNAREYAFASAENLRLAEENASLSAEIAQHQDDGAGARP